MNILHPPIYTDRLRRNGARLALISALAGGIVLEGCTTDADPTPTPDQTTSAPANRDPLCAVKLAGYDGKDHKFSVELSDEFLRNVDQVTAIEVDYGDAHRDAWRRESPRESISSTFEHTFTGAGRRRVGAIVRFVAAPNVSPDIGIDDKGAHVATPTPKNANAQRMAPCAPYLVVTE